MCVEVLVLWWDSWCPFYFNNYLGEEDYFTLILLWLCAISLPHGAMGWSAVCDWHFLVILTVLCIISMPGFITQIMKFHKTEVGVEA